MACTVALVAFKAAAPTTAAAVAVAACLLLCLACMQRRMVDGNMFIDAKGPYKSLQELWDDGEDS